MSLKIMQPAYAWLEKEGAPKMLVEALKLYGIMEKPGPGSNPVILGWAKELGLGPDIYSDDAVPWCSLFMSVVAKRAGKFIPFGGYDLLRAKSWARFGTQVTPPMLGDVLVFMRPDGFHVGLYVGEDSTAYHVLGGNQGDSVDIARIAQARLVCCRRPVYSIGQPANVRRVFLAPTGMLSLNEK